MYDKKYLRKVRHDESVPLLLPKSFKFLAEPYRHQVVTFMYALHYKDLAILSTMGTGKTYCAINIARYWMQEGQANKVLVVAPTTVLNNWADEIDLYSEYRSVVLHDSVRAKRIALFKKEAEFYIINYEATLGFLPQILRLNADIVIFDESSRIANSKAQQTKQCMEIAGHAKYRYILNGTPIANKPIDLWSQFYALDFGDTLGSSLTSYRKMYFATIPIQNQGKWFSIYKVRNKACMEDIAGKVAKKSIRYLKEECIKDMPEKSYMRRYISLPKGTRKLYDEVESHAIVELSKLGQNITANIVLTKFVKALQITSGYLKSDSGDIIQMKRNPKLDELKSIIEEVVPESAMVIWCKYLHTIKLVQQMLDKMRLEYLTIKGDVEDKSGVAKLFQQTSIEDIPIIICQIRSGGIGINLHKATYAVYVENEWRLQDRYQSEDRIHRIGQKNACTYIDLVVRGTIDEFVLNSIRMNKDIAEYILERIK